MCAEELKIALVTGHLPVAKVSQVLTKQRIGGKLEMFRKSLIDDFGILKPRIAVLGLNPHAGEDGLLGKEEKEVISPVIQSFKEKGNLVFGPFASDGFFGAMGHKKYDGVLAMYHDQALIPFKYIAFDTGVNFTAGLPIVRTSPDHGTAYDLTGKGTAEIGSFREALFLAKDIATKRSGKVHNQLRATFTDKKPSNKSKSGGQAKTQNVKGS